MLNTFSSLDGLKNTWNTKIRSKQEVPYVTKYIS